MINIDWTIIPAIVVFILTIVALNYLLFKPVLRVQEEREGRTTGLMARTRQDVDHQLRLFDQYQATLKNARIEGYRQIEKARSEALRYRSELLEQGRNSADQMIREARDSIQDQVASAKASLEIEARDIANSITSVILQRSA